MSTKTFLIRVDASPQMGSGHFMRMLALAQMLSDNGQKVHFATIIKDTESLAILASQKFKIHLLSSPFSEIYDVISLVDLAKENNANWIVVDGYHFTSNYEKSVKEKLPNVRLMRVEDVPTIHHFADILLSPNYDSESMEFSAEPYTLKLLGLKFLLLRREFYRDGVGPEFGPQLNSQRLLITLGGGTPQADVANLKLAEILSDIEIDDLAVTLVSGRLSQNADRLKKKLKSGHTFFTHCDNMANQIKQANIAIVSGGSTMWELMYMGIPFLTIALTRVQDDYLKKMHKKNLCIHLGYFSDIDPIEVRQSILKFIDNLSLQAEFKKNYLEIFGEKNHGKSLLDLLLF